MPRVSSGIYGSSSSGGGIYGGSGYTPAAGTGGGASKSEHHSLLHEIFHAPATFTGHLLGDVRDAAVGLPAGLVMSVEHPVRSAEMIGKTTWHDWSPLFHSNFKQFGHNFMAHPLAPILDVAGLVTGGAGLAARGGEAAATLGLISREGKLAELSGSASEARRVAALGRGENIDSKVTKLEHVQGKPTYARHLDSNPIVRLRQEQVHRLTSHLSEAAPKWFGRTTDAEGATTLGKVRDFSAEGRAARHFQRQESYRAGATSAMIHAQLAAFVKAGHDISAHPAETFKSIWRDGRTQLENHAYQVPYEDAKKLGTEFTFVKDRSHRDLKTTPAVHTVQDFQNGMEAFKGLQTTQHLDEAQKLADGKVLVVHKRAAQAWGKEGARSATFLTKLYRYPTKAWKYMVLATRPAYFVNNAVGNTFMAMGTLGPVAFTRGLVDAYRQVHGERAAASELSTADKALHGLQGDWQSKHYLGVHQGFAQEVMTGGASARLEREAGEPGTDVALNLNERVKGHPRVAHVVRVAEHGLYPITHKVSDVFLRRVMINSLLRRHGAVRGLMDQGVPFDRAAEFVSRDIHVRDKIQEQVNNALGDYHHFNPVEKQVRNLVPFYSWDRAIARHGVHMALDKTGRTAVAARAGQMGTQETTNALGGNIPDFLKGVLALGGGHGGRQNILTTQGLNPYSSLPDVADTIGALVGAGHANAGSVLSGQVNPLITAAIESATGQSLLSGAKLKQGPGGIMGNVAKNTFAGLPLPTLINTLVNGEAKPKPNARTGAVKPFLYQKDAISQLLASLGVPIKHVDTGAASALADKQNGVKRGRKKHSGGVYG